MLQSFQLEFTAKTLFEKQLGANGMSQNSPKTRMQGDQT